MKFLATLLLICSTMFVQAQDYKSTETAGTNTVTAVSAVASELEKAEAVNVYTSRSGTYCCESAARRRYLRCIHSGRLG